ncbi:hypothetical protein [Halopelagius longus]|uniref:Uncharacterized protein n=1 Tax=Halopelagius longus TaxID=1236180 RepID=A0A1H0Y9N7_9EURY|nr:hypothetical protein [Halopelagius longus]RDI72362.1 hypothetical protein DWB78_11910 [Halopelagius longus]SDQ11802.1 hypothetical protein SAMN05216278_0493 [Halopelagius longus]
MSDTERQSDDTPEIPVETGKATIVYEHPEEGKKEVTVSNEQVVYAQDHWAFMSGTDEEGNDLVRRVPRDRVHYVERNVQKFEEEVRTVRHRVESLANEVRQKLPVNASGGGREAEQGQSEPHRIEVEDDDATTDR